MSKSSGVTVVREIGKSLPEHVLRANLEKYGNALSYAAATTNKTHVVVRKHLEKLSYDAAKILLDQKGLADRHVIIHFSGVEKPTAENVSPFTLLEGEVTTADGKVMRKPLIVGYLNGNFSQYPGGEVECVTKDIIPRVKKAFMYADNDVPKTMIELNEDINASWFANLMVGDTGSITLLAANGDTNTFLVAGENISREFSDYWTSDAHATTPTVGAAPIDDLDAELGGEAPASAPAAVPAPKKASPPPPPDAKPAAKPGPAPAPDATPKPKDSVIKTDTGKEADDNPKLTIAVPPNMEKQKKIKWISTRLPEGFVPKEVSGLTTITCTRNQAPKKFLQTYIEQNKLRGLEDIVAFATGVAKVTPTATAGVAKPTSVPKSGPAKPPEQATGKETEYPASKPAEAPASPDVKETPAAAPTEVPTPVFSPRQVEELVTFSKHETTKAAVDRHGKLISDPKAFDALQKSVSSFATQFGGELNLINIASWPIEALEQFNVHDPKSGAKVMYFLSLELLSAFAMLDELTGKKPEEVKQEIAPPAAKKRSGIPALPPELQKTA